MALTRLKRFESYIAQDSRYANTVEDVVKLLNSAMKYLGEEIDRIEKNIGASPEAASGGTVILTTAGGSSTTGIIAIIQRTVVAGTNVINFTSALSSATYGGFLVLSDSGGMLIESVELRMRATSMTTSGFVYNAPQAGTLYGFAVVAS